MKFRIKIEMVSMVSKHLRPGLYEIGGKLLEGDIANGSCGYVQLKGERVRMTVKEVAFLTPRPPDKIGFSVQNLPCTPESLIGQEFVSD